MEIMAKGKAANMRVIRLWIVCSSWITTSIYQEMACKMWATEMEIERTAMRERDTGQRQCTGISSEIFELNPKTKWKLLISLALILLSAPLRFHSVDPRYFLQYIYVHETAVSPILPEYFFLGWDAYCERAFAFALIRTYINCACACACLYLCNFSFAFFSSRWIVIINLLRNFFQSIKHTKCKLLMLQCHSMNELVT